MRLLSLIALLKILFISVRAVDATPLFQNTDWSGISGLNAWVKTIVADDEGNVYVGGGFTHAGSLEVNYVAKWDGASWHSLGGGMNYHVRSLVVGLDGKLYAGGDFTEAGGVSAEYVAVWDGSEWAGLGDGFDYRVFKLLSAPDGSIYAGGIFEFSGTTEVNNISKWDGSSWVALGTGLSAFGSDSTYVLDMALGQNGELFVSGDFKRAGGVSSYHVAEWRANQWHAIDYFFSRSVVALAVEPNSGNLYAYGYKFGMWDGDSWTLLPESSRIAGTMLDIEFDGLGNLYACGTINEVDASPAGHIISWDGLNINTLGVGLDNSARALYIDSQNNHLYVGGYFLSAGEESTAYIAKADISRLCEPFEQLDSIDATSDLDNDGNSLVMELMFGGDPDTPDTIQAIQPLGFLSGENLLELDSGLPLNSFEEYATYKVIKRRNHPNVTVSLLASGDMSFTPDSGFFVSEVGEPTEKLTFREHVYAIFPGLSTIDSGFLRYEIDLTELD